MDWLILNPKFVHQFEKLCNYSKCYSLQNSFVPKRYKGKSPSPALSATKKIYDVERAGSFGQISPPAKSICKYRRAGLPTVRQVMKNLGLRKILTKRKG